MQIVLNVIFTSALISLVLWIAKANPKLGGFVLSLPTSTLIALAFSKIQNGDEGNTIEFAKSIFVGIPATLLFFVPFLLAEKFKMSFWTSYVCGILLLSVSYVLHKKIMSVF